MKYTIKELRQFKGITQEFMAKKLGMSQPSYKRFETGKTKIAEKKINLIAKILEVKPTDLLNHSSGSIGKILNNINQIRRTLNISQFRISEKLGMTQNNYSLLETGKTQLTINRLQEIGEIFNMPLSKIINYHLETSKQEHKTVSNQHSLRDYFAGKVLQGLSTELSLRDHQYIARTCYLLADAMLKERDKVKS